MIQLIPAVTSGFSPEGAEQALIIGYSIALSPKPHEPYGWQVNAAIDGAEVHLDVEVMVWSDIVKRWMASCIFDSHIQILRLWSRNSTPALLQSRCFLGPDFHSH